MGDYNPKIYIRSDWDATVASEEVEGKLDDFQLCLESLIRQIKSTWDQT